MLFCLYYTKGRVRREGTAIANELLINSEIRAKEVRLIGQDGKQIGIVSLEEAMRHAEEADLDLVNISPKAEPPVCRIMDYGKYRFEQEKKLKEQKKNQQAQKVKEIKFRLHIDTHDYEVKLNHAKEFLAEGNKLRVTITFRGRELSHPEMGFELVTRITEDLAEVAVVDASAKLLGKNINMSFNPKA